MPESWPPGADFSFIATQAATSWLRTLVMGSHCGTFPPTGKPRPRPSPIPSMGNSLLRSPLGRTSLRLLCHDRASDCALTQISQAINEPRPGDKANTKTRQPEELVGCVVILVRGCKREKDRGHVKLTLENRPDRHGRAHRDTQRLPAKQFA